jgi:hypothetical protein
VESVLLVLVRRLAIARRLLDTRHAPLSGGGGGDADCGASWVLPSPDSDSDALSDEETTELQRLWALLGLSGSVSNTVDAAERMLTAAAVHGGSCVFPSDRLSVSLTCLPFVRLVLPPPTPGGAFSLVALPQSYQQLFRTYVAEPCDVVRVFLSFFLFLTSPLSLSSSDSEAVGSVTRCPARRHCVCCAVGLCASRAAAVAAAPVGKRTRCEQRNKTREREL